MKTKSIILLSAGLDSTVNLAIAKKKSNVILAITFDYYQKSARREILQSRKICSHYGIRHTVIKLPFFKDSVNSSLLKGSHLKCSCLTEKDFKNKSKMKKIAQMVWVPNRNGLFVNIAAAIAEAMGADEIVMGLNKEEGESFPDNGSAFLMAVNKVLQYSTLKKVKLVSYTTNRNKREIVKVARKYNVPLNLVWSCYFGQKKPCLKCVSCLRFIRALGMNNEVRIRNYG